MRRIRIPKPRPGKPATAELDVRTPSGRVLLF